MVEGWRGLEMGLEGGPFLLGLGPTQKEGEEGGHAITPMEQQESIVGID
jgi:hypothetical protein